MSLSRPWKFLLACALVATAADGNGDSASLQEARGVLARLAAKERGAKTLRIQFESQATGPDGDWLPKSAGLLWAADSGRFRIEYSQGLVVCDGRTVWQYFPSNKQVILKRAEDGFAAAASGGVLLRFLQARALSAQRVRDGLRVVLDPATEGENLDSLILTLDPRPPALRRVETQNPTGTRTVYRIQSDAFGVRFRPGTFSFVPPPDVEVVDMR